MTSLEELYFSDTHANSGMMSIVAEKVTLRLTCKQVSETIRVTEVQSTARRLITFVRDGGVSGWQFTLVE